MNRIALMISKMVAVRFLGILFGLTLFLLTLEIAAYSNEILSLDDGGYQMILLYLVKRVPGTFAVFLPMCLLLAMLLSLTELSYRNELTAIWATGVSPLKLFVLMLPLAFLIGAFHFVLVDRMVPWAAPQLRDWGIAQYSKKKLQIDENDPIWLRSGSDIMRAARASANSKLLEDLVIFRRDPDGILREQIFAKSARETKDGWLLENTLTYKRNNNLPLPAAKLIYQGQVRPAERGLRSGDPEEMSLTELNYFVDNNGFGIRPAHVYQSWRMERLTPFALAAMIFALTIPLSARFRRGGGLGFLFLAGVALGFLFFILDGIALVMGELGMLPPIAAAWLMPLIFGLIAAYFLTRTATV